MRDLLVFDLDGTLCPVGKGMNLDDVLLLRNLEQLGYTIIICSGKPTYYLCGFARQLNLEHPVLVGENGGTFQFGVSLPPEKYYEYPYPQSTKKTLLQIHTRIDNAVSGRVWYQPNEIGITPFPKDKDVFDIIQRVLEESKDIMDGINVYRHIDSFDIVPNCINKKNGMEFLAKLLEADRSRFIAIGDGVNDIPMFDFANISILVGGKLDYAADLQFRTINEALQYLVNVL